MSTQAACSIDYHELPGTQGLSLLLVEDNPGDAELLQAMLCETEGQVPDICHCDCLAGAFDALSSTRFDAVLLDLSLPDSQGVDTLRKLQDGGIDIPVIVLTGLDSDESALEAVHEGAQDYIGKNHMTGPLLLRSIMHSIERQRLMHVATHFMEQDLRRKDAFISHISHELRSPMSSIYQFVSLLQDGAAGEMNGEQQEMLESVMRNTKRLRKMIDELLEMSRSGMNKLKVEPRYADVASMTDEVTGSIAGVFADRDIALEVSAEPGLPPVYADPARYSQILANLLDNAGKFTPPGGHVAVTLAPLDGGDLVEITVRDDGIGIEPENAERLFERMYQQDESIDVGLGGLGLGLHLCRQLVEAHGGTIRAVKNSGPGSRFIFTLRAFDLDGVVRPLLQAGSRELPGLCILGIEVDAHRAHPQAGSCRHVLDAVRAAVSRSIRPESDRLLSGFDLTDTGERLLVIAGADSQGGEALMRRLDRCIGSDDAVDDAVRLSIGMEYVFTREDLDRASVSCGEIVRRIDRIIKGQSSQRG